MSLLAWYDAIYPPAPHWTNSFYPYQYEFAQAAERAVADCRSLSAANLTLAFRCARQGGKNETSARLEVRLMCKYARAGGTIVKTAPTEDPQLEYSKARLIKCLQPLGDSNDRQKPWKKHGSFSVSMGDVSVLFLSGDTSARREGATASLCLEVDEAQHFDETVFGATFNPMTAKYNAPRFLYGSCWSADSLLEREVDRLRNLERSIGRRLVFEYDWQTVAYYDPAYLAHVEGEKARLGEDHPVFQSQYCLRPIEAMGRMFLDADLACCMGGYPHASSPTDGSYYVAGIDLAGADEMSPEQMVDPRSRKRDGTVVTIAKLLWRTRQGEGPLPILHIVDHLYRPGTHPELLVDELYNFCFVRWRCVSVAVDATGVGDSIAATLANRRPGQAHPIKASANNVSSMAFKLLAAMKTGRLKVYRVPEDPMQRQVWNEFWRQMRYCQKTVSQTRTGQAVMNFGAPTSKRQAGVISVGETLHDDFPKSLGLCVEAAREHLYRRMAERIPPTAEYAYVWGRGYE